MDRAPTLALVTCLCLCLGCGIGDVDEDDPGIVSIQGSVSSESGGAPIAGAVVSTSIDGQTATTDSSGGFLLETVATGDWCCTEYTITIAAAGFETFSQSHVWGQNPVGHEFILTPVP